MSIVQWYMKEYSVERRMQWPFMGVVFSEDWGFRGGRLISFYMFRGVIGTSRVQSCLPREVIAVTEVRKWS